MTLAITSPTAPKDTRYGTSAQTEAAAKSENTGTRATSVAANDTSTGNNLPPLNRVQATSEIEKAVTDINDYVQTISRDLQFSIEEDLPLGRTVIRVLDTETQEVIREFPSEEAIAMARHINEQLSESDEVDSFMLSELI